MSWSVWAVSKLLSALYRPTVNNFRTTTSVIVPSYHEDPDILEDCLDTWLAENPHEVVIVLDVADSETQRRMIARNDSRLHVIMFAHRGKRSALGVGIRAATCEVVVLTDSDRHALGSRVAGCNPDALYRSDGRRCRHAAERLRT